MSTPTDAAPESTASRSGTPQTPLPPDVSDELLRRVEAFLLLGRLRVYSGMLYIGMRREFFHCRLIFEHWIAAVEQLRTLTVLWEGFRHAEQQADTAVSRVRVHLAVALRQLQRVKDDSPTPSRVKPAGRGRRAGEDRDDKAIRYYADGLALAAGHVRAAVLELYDFQSRERAGLVAHPELGTEEKFRAVLPAVDERLTVDRLAERSPAVAQLRDRHKPHFLLLAALGELRDALNGQKPSWGLDALDEIEALAARHRSLPNYFIYCLLTRLAAQLAAQVAVLDPEKLAEPKFQLLHTLHTLTGRSLQAVADGPKHLRGAIWRRLRFLGWAFPNVPDWRAKYREAARDPDDLNLPARLAGSKPVPA